MLDAERESFPLSRIRSIRRFKLKWQPDHVSIKCNGPIHVSDKFNDVLSLVDITHLRLCWQVRDSIAAQPPSALCSVLQKLRASGTSSTSSSNLVPHCRQ